MEKGQRRVYAKPRYKKAPWPKGKPRDPFSETHRKNLSDAQTHRWQNPQEREKQRRKALARPSSFYGRMRAAQRQWSHSPEGQRRLREIRMAQAFPKKMTDLERTLYQEFRSRRLRFEMHKTMFGRFQPDFVFEDVRLIVQADGTYWHRKPGVRDRDRTFNEMAAADGWTVWRFAETEIKMHPQACARAIARFVRSH